MLSCFICQLTCRSCSDSPCTLAQPIQTNAQSQDNFGSESTADKEHAGWRPVIAEKRIDAELCPEPVFSLQLMEPDEQENVGRAETSTHDPVLSTKAAGKQRAEVPPDRSLDTSQVGERPRCESDQTSGDIGSNYMCVDDDEGKATEMPAPLPHLGASLNPVRHLYLRLNLLICIPGRSIQSSGSVPCILLLHLSLSYSHSS